MGRDTPATLGVNAVVLLSPFGGDEPYYRTHARHLALHAHPNAPCGMPPGEVLRQVEATAFLQTVTLLATHARRKEELEASGGVSAETPLSCKRRDVLRLPLEAFRKWAKPALAAYEKLAPLVHEEHVFAGRDVPYATQLVPLAAIVARLAQSANHYATKEKLRLEGLSFSDS